MRSIINIKGKLIDLDRPTVMGILNVTDDSFYDGGKYNTIDAAVGRAQQMIDDGATFIDVGGMSSRPGAHEISVDEELKRVIPVIKAVSQNIPDAVISIDTYRSRVAEKAIESGAAMINDISAGDLDKGMFDLVRDLRIPYIAMHMKGTPETMQKDPQYEDVVQDVMDYFLSKKVVWDKLGIMDVIIDPGFGFGKTVDHNYRLLSAIQYLGKLDYPVLAGVSRKSMINKVLDIRPEAALNGTTAVNMIALMRNASILRVHDVKEAAEVLKIYSVFTKNDINQNR